MQCRKLYQLGNWKAGKTRQSSSMANRALYQLGNWKAGKTAIELDEETRALYQLGNWKAGKTSTPSSQAAPKLYQLGNWKALIPRKSAFRWKERLSGDSKAFLNAQIRRPLEGKIEHLRRDADAAHLRLPVERLFARQQIAKTPLVENLIGSVCITNSLARFCR